MVSGDHNKIVCWESLSSVRQNLGRISSVLKRDKSFKLHWYLLLVAVASDLVFYLGDREEEIEQPPSLKGKWDAFKMEWSQRIRDFSVDVSTYFWVVFNSCFQVIVTANSLWAWSAVFWELPVTGIYSWSVVSRGIKQVNTCWCFTVFQMLCWFSSRTDILRHLVSHWRWVTLKHLS